MERPKGPPPAYNIVADGSFLAARVSVRPKLGQPDLDLPLAVRMALTTAPFTYDFALERKLVEEESQREAKRVEERKSAAAAAISAKENIEFEPDTVTSEPRGTKGTNRRLSGGVNDASMSSGLNRVQSDTSPGRGRARSDSASATTAAAAAYVLLGNSMLLPPATFESRPKTIFAGNTTKDHAREAVSPAEAVALDKSRRFLTVMQACEMRNEQQRT